MVVGEALEPAIVLGGIVLCLVLLVLAQRWLHTS